MIQRHTCYLTNKTWLWGQYCSYRLPSP